MEEALWLIWKCCSWWMCQWGQKTRNNDIKLLMNNNPAALKVEPDCLTGEISGLRHTLHHSAKSKVFLNEAARGDSPAPSLLRPASLFAFWTRMLVLLRCGASRPWFHFEVWSGEHWILTLVVKVGKFLSMEFVMTWGHPCCFHALEQILAHAKNPHLIWKMT